MQSAKPSLISLHGTTEFNRMVSNSFINFLKELINMAYLNIIFYIALKTSVSIIDIANRRGNATPLSQ